MNVSHHYDISDDLYDLFLDPKRQYSCAYFKNKNDSLETAQNNKIQHIIKKLNIQPNQKILDIGCGGGILTEPLARLGAKVCGIDENENAIKVATDHAKKNKLNIDYKKMSFDKINFSKKFDVIVCMEVLEHLYDVDMLVSKVSQILKPSG